MAYNPYSAVEAIYNYKKQWDEGNQAGDEAKKKDAADRAKAYYEQLRGNGYADVADALSASNYTQSKAIRDKWAKMGKTSANDYLYSLGASKGMSQSDVDKLIKVDALTGELSFGGKKVGAADSIVDGVSYWADTSALDTAFNDYVSRADVAPSASKLSAVNSMEVKDKINDLWGTQKSDREMMTGKYDTLEDYNYNHNPYETEIGKSIMEDYKWQGQRASEGEIAGGAGANGGNIDSFAAANAARQQLAFTNAGKQAVLNDHNVRIANAMSILSGMGVYLQNQDTGMQNTIQIQQNEAQRQFENDETAKDNEVKRLSDQAAVTGVVPEKWRIQDDPFLKQFVDADGKLKPEYYSTDFQALIDKAKAAGNTERANQYAILRGLKIFGNFAEYGKYLGEGDIAFSQPQKTEAARQFDADIDLSNRTLNAEREEAAADRQNKLDQIRENAKYSNTSSGGDEPQMTISDAIAAIQAGIVTQKIIDVYNDWYGSSYTVNNPPPLSVPGGDKPEVIEEEPTLTKAETLDALKSGIITDVTIAAYNHYYGGNYTVKNPPRFDEDGKLITPTTPTTGGADGLVNVIPISPTINESRIKSCGVDQYGKAMIEALITESKRGKNGGVLTEDEIFDFVVANSDAYATNKDQLKKVYAYLGIDKSWLDDVEDAGTFPWEWNKGVRRK